MNSTVQLLAYFQPTMPLPDPWTPEMMSIWLPVFAYWAYSLTFHFLMKAEIPFFEKYRIHTPEDMKKRNRVTVTRVLVMVSIQQCIQMVLAYLLQSASPDAALLAAKQEAAIARLSGAMAALTSRYGALERFTPMTESFARFMYCGLRPAAQLFMGMVIMDTHQYFLHRLFHVNKFCYKHFHSHHHRLYVPYAFGALYNHPVEGFLLDTVGGALAYELTGMTPFMGMVFFTISTLKTVDDHCGYAFPWDPLQMLFSNNAVYHDIHHQPYGIKKNFSQPYFTFWDTWLGTMH